MTQGKSILPYREGATRPLRALLSEKDDGIIMVTILAIVIVIGLIIFLVNIGSIIDAVIRIGAVISITILMILLAISTFRVLGKHRKKKSGVPQGKLKK